MKEAAIMMIALLFFAGCAAEEPEETTTTTSIETTTTLEPATTITTTSDLATTTTLASTASTTLPGAGNLSINESCKKAAECASGCCNLSDAGRICQPAQVCNRQTNESDCFSKNMHWCATKCQKDPCSNCGTYMRCVNTQAGIMVEYATDYAGRTDSCIFNARYEKASGEGSYCDKNEGSLMYGKCGGEATYLDCMNAYQNSTSGTYAINQQRSFHSSAGEEFDLWCFKCDRVG